MILAQSFLWIPWQKYILNFCISNTFKKTYFPVHVKIGNFHIFKNIFQVQRAIVHEIAEIAGNYIHTLHHLF